ncbi:hypothetical protein [Natrinema sp. DC36]|uniref:hypothetical protein n=1 Tax=Natrinema sp. DC36 TaxID=2878680 RepID=UPI001CF02A2F|nr:hypothetical protein [Natrinema sp. DC36]
MTDDPILDDDYIVAKREDVLNALDEEGISKEELAEMSADEVLDAVGTAMVKNHPDDGDFDVDEEARKIIEESAEMGDRGAKSPPEGQTCEREGCDRDAVAGPGEEWLCAEHQKEFFSERHN